MAKKNFKVKCAGCDKPFHFIPKSESNEPGEIEIALNCPFCETQLMVKVPRRWGGKETIFRGAAAEELLTSRKA